MSDNLCEGGRGPTFLPNRARSGLNPALIAVQHENIRDGLDN